MSNTVIALRSSGTASNSPNPLNLEYGELALNYADGILYYRTTSDTLGSILTTEPSGLSGEIQFNDAGNFGASANLSFNSATQTLTVDNIVSDTTNTIYIHANAAFDHANAAFDYANTLSGGSNDAATLYTYYDKFTGNSSNTIFTLSNDTTTNNALVTINGVSQEPTVVYSITNNVLTFTSAPPTDSIVEIRYESISSATGTLAQYNLFKYTAANTQTTFTGIDDNGKTLSYQENFITVFVNGVKLTDSDYVANTGTSVILSESTSANDIVEIQSFALFYITEADVTLNYGAIASNTNTTTSVTSTVCDSFSATTYRSAKYFIQITDNTNNDYYATDAIVLHDNSNSFISIYGEIYSNTSLATFDTDINNGYVRLLVTPITANSTIKTIRTTVTA